MKLTKEQITFIENRLTKKGVTYWDIRIEMLDHLVLETEKQMENGKPFDTAMNYAFKIMHWNGRSLREVVRSKLFLINGKIRKQYFNEALSVFTNPKKLISFLLFIFCYVLLAQKVDFNILKKVSLILLLTPTVIGVVLYLFSFVRKNKSGIMNYATFYIYFSFLMLQGFIHVMKPDGGYFEVSNEVYIIVIQIVVILNTLFTYAGISVFIKNKKETDVVFNKLQSL